MKNKPYLRILTCGQLKKLEKLQSQLTKKKSKNSRHNICYSKYNIKDAKKQNYGQNYGQNIYHAGDIINYYTHNNEFTLKVVTTTSFLDDRYKKPRYRYACNILKSKKPCNFISLSIVK